MKVAIIYNEPKHTAAEDHWLHRSASSHAPQEDFVDASEFGVLEQMQSIADAVREHGHEVVIFSADDDVPRLCSFLSHEKPEVIFNCCESILGKSKLEMNVAAMYELFGVEYTGSPSLTLGVALNKGLAKSIFVANKIPTPRYQVFEAAPFTNLDTALRFPLITKPIREDASIGIDAKSIVDDIEGLRERVEFILSEFDQPALVEEYIEGRELNVGLIGTESGELMPLPISEITFDAVPEGLPHIVSYEAKWVEDSPLYKTTIPVCPADVTQEVASEAQAIALRAAKAIGLRDYGRVDLRLDRNGNLFVLEANPNPDISEDAGFMRAARISGRSYAGTINEILELAIERSKMLQR